MLGGVKTTPSPGLKRPRLQLAAAQAPGALAEAGDISGGSWEIEGEAEGKPLGRCLFVLQVGARSSRFERLE